ncbi:UDP-N-acetylglucosamine 1-carboxyvinyltransferase [Streptococcus pneumoniae]|nr:UDP-N-acetylglucosamine 1-carboxyvinyltransferase [Streptococcus pneumoniae]
MDKIVVQGGDNRLVGSVTIEGAKNAVLPLLAATILASEGKTVLQNVPILSDVFIMNQVVGGLNAKVDFDEEAHLVKWMLLATSLRKPLTSMSARCAPPSLY